jgi:hypothetical protein
MTAALDEVVTDAALRNAFFKHADCVRNDPENLHDNR